AAAGRPVAAQHLSLRPVSRSRAVGMQDEPPAQPVNTDIVVELAQKYATRYRSPAAVGLVDQMVHIAVRRGLVAAGPLAVPGAQLHRAADGAGDARAEPYVQGNGPAVVGGVEEALAQRGGQPVGPGDELDGE